MSNIQQHDSARVVGRGRKGAHWYDSYVCEVLLISHILTFSREILTFSHSPHAPHAPHASMLTYQNIFPPYQLLPLKRKESNSVSTGLPPPGRVQAKIVSIQKGSVNVDIHDRCCQHCTWHEHTTHGPQHAECSQHQQLTSMFI